MYSTTAYIIIITNTTTTTIIIIILLLLPLLLRLLRLLLSYINLYVYVCINQIYEHVSTSNIVVQSVLQLHS